MFQDSYQLSRKQANYKVRAELNLTISKKLKTNQLPVPSMKTPSNVPVDRIICRMSARNSSNGTDNGSRNSMTTE